MKKSIFLVTFFISTISFGNGFNEDFPGANSTTYTYKNIRGNGLMFTPNKGQVADMDGHLRPDVLYKGDANGTGIYLRRTGISYVFSNVDQLALQEDTRLKKEDSPLGHTNIQVHRVDMDFINCNNTVSLINENEVEGFTNYYLPQCPHGVTRVSSYNKVSYRNIYNDVDIVYYGDKTTGIKYDFVVKPYADPSQIKIRWSGAQHIHIDDNGGLVVKTSLNEFYESIPKVYQVINGVITVVDAEYVFETYDEGGQNGDGIITFKLANYNRAFPLIIDPWLSYFGGGGTDYGTGIATDNMGNVVFTGYTASVNFPVTAGATQAANGGVNDIFIAKFDAAGVRQWTTYYGGSGTEYRSSITADNTGNVFVTGMTSSNNFPTVFLGGAYNQAANAGADDAFIIKLSNAGASSWATYYGGSGADEGRGITTDAANNLLITGCTASPDFPVSVGAYQVNNNGSYDAFIIKFASAGNRLWATYVGGSSYENGYSIATYNSGDIVITGVTVSNDFPTLLGTQMTYIGSQDVYVARFTATGNLQWATYYGGAGGDYGAGLAIDNTGNIIITGYTYSNNFLVTAGAYQTAYGGGTAFGGDGYAVKFNSAGTPLWATYIGGNLDEQVYSVVTDTKNNIYIYGEFEDSGPGNYPISTCAYQSTNGGGPFNGDEDMFIAKYDSAGVQKCITYVGGTSEDDFDNSQLTGIAISGNNLYITGNTRGGYPVTSGAFQTNYVGGGGGDAFIDQICINICEAQNLGLNFSASDTNVCPNTLITFTSTVNNACDTSGYQYLWTFMGGNPSSSTLLNPSVTYSAGGSYPVKLVLTTLCKKDSIVNSNYVTVSPVINTNGVVNICTGQSSIIHGVSQNTSGVYTQTFSSVVSGCDSVSAITLTVSNPATTNGNINICNGQSALIHGVNQSIAGVYTQTFVGVNTCDSISSITLNVNSATTATISPISCSSYTVNGQVYTSSGVYTQTLANVSSCDSILTINFTRTPAINTNNNVVICSGSSANIHGNIQTTAGIYTQSFVTGSGCDSSSTINLSVLPTPTLSVSPLLDTIEKGNSITITATGAAIYNWDNGVSTSVISVSPTQTTQYCVIGTNSVSCADTICSDIIVADFNCDNVKIFIPNGFSPNGDGQNDELGLFATGSVNTMRFAIYNRWGQVVFETDNIAKKWNGFYKGQPLDAGVFTYTLSYTCRNDNKDAIISGNISLVR